MRLKTLGVFVITALAFFTVFYWVTDEARRDAFFDHQQEELLEFGLEIFGPDTLTVTVNVTPSGFEPEEVAIPVNGTVRFENRETEDVVVSSSAGGSAFNLVVQAESNATRRFITDGTIDVVADGIPGSLTVVIGPEALSDAAANCARCHGADGTGGAVGDTGRLAPNLHSRSLVDKLRVNSEYVNLVIRFGGVVVSGDVNSPMPAWSTEVGGPLTKQQIDALTALIESWAAETAEQPVEEIPDTPEAGREVYASAGCGGCHGADLAGTDIGPGLLTIGSEPVTDELPTPISQLDQLIADYEEDPRAMLERWIRDSGTNYNDGTSTGMPPFPESQLSESALQALITFLLTQE